MKEDKVPRDGAHMEKEANMGTQKYEPLAQNLEEVSKETKKNIGRKPFSGKKHSIIGLCLCIPNAHFHAINTIQLVVLNTSSCTDLIASTDWFTSL